MSLHRDDRQRREELLYLLTYLSHKAGRLMEAAIYGETIARTGDPSASATRDGASIALAALQEASAIHWGKPDDVGELRYMQSIAEVIDARWPDDSQHNEIWFTLAQSYAAFGQYEHATRAYAKVRKESSLYADAKLGSGTAYWSLFLHRASQPDVDPDAMLALLSKASQQYNAAVKVLESKLRSPTLPLLTAKQMIAIIADRTGDSNAVIRSTTTGKFPLVQSLRIGPPSPRGKRKRGPPKTLAVPSDFSRTVLQLLYRAQTQRGDLQAAQRTLSQLDKLPDAKGGKDVESMQLATTVRRFKGMIAKQRIVMPEIKELDAMLAKLPPKSNAVSPQDWLWIGQSWAQLASKAINAQTAKACYDRAAKTCSVAIALPSFPEDRVAATQVRHAEWLRRAGKTQASLNVLAEILEKSPNVFDLQTQAAMSLEKLAIEQDSEPDLRAAIRGPDDQPAIWGWSKLAVQLHKLRYSDRGTVEHADALLAAHFHLARCRWMLVEVLGCAIEDSAIEDSATEDSTPGGVAFDGVRQQNTLRKQTLKQIANARLAIPPDTDLDAKWSKTFGQLESELSTNQ
ncbi:hypothetical protein RSSM_06835 [Rhodopirellula sallentina SM41]|uniref:Uncharacterized protein n=2 Tax=Rhodopirellula TaxID=265488 RepID=M5U6X8_9BACT|nr:hypothetical protein RSSM_06835 [Rhodopirellula sallentina SM41]